jgi:hypothetical protein
VSRNIPLQNVPSVRIYQDSHIQSVGIFQHTIFSQQVYSSTKCSANKDIPGTKYPVSRNMPVQNVQPVKGYFRTVIFSG